MTKFKSASIYLFVMLMLVLVVSMLFGYQSMKQKVNVTEGLSTATEPTTMTPNMSTANVSELNKTLMIINTSLKTSTGGSLEVMIDAIDDSNPTYAVVIINTEKGKPPSFVVLPYNSSSSGHIAPVSSPKLPTTGPGSGSASYSWIASAFGLKIVYNLIDSVANVFLFNDKNELVSSVFVGFYDDGLTGQIRNLKHVELKDESLGESIQHIKNTSTSYKLPKSIQISEKFFIHTSNEFPVVTSWKIGKTETKLNETEDNDSFITTKDARILLFFINDAMNTTYYVNIIILSLDMSAIKLTENIRINKPASSESGPLSKKIADLAKTPEFEEAVDAVTSEVEAALSRMMGGPGMGAPGMGMGGPGMGAPGMGMGGPGMGYPGMGMGGPGMGYQGGWQQGPFNQGPMVPIFMCSQFNPDGSCAKFSGQNGQVVSPSPAPSSSSSPSPSPAPSPSPSPSPSEYSDSLGGVANNVVDKGTGLASQVVDKGTGLASQVVNEATGLVAGAGELAAGTAAGAKDLVEDAGAGATDLLKSGASGTKDLLEDVGSGALKVASGIGSELSYLARSAIDGRSGAGSGAGAGSGSGAGSGAGSGSGSGAAAGGPTYAAINAVGPAYVTGYGNNIAPDQIPSIYNYYGSSDGSAQQTWNVMPISASMSTIACGAGCGGGR